MALKDLAASFLAIDRDRRVAGALPGGVALLLFELRFEHREVLGETWHSWIPLVYSSVTLLAGLSTAPSEHQNVVVTGSTGTGKTYVACASRSRRAARGTAPSTGEPPGSPTS